MLMLQALGRQAVVTLVRKYRTTAQEHMPCKQAHGSLRGLLRCCIDHAAGIAGFAEAASTAPCLRVGCIAGHVVYEL